MKTLFEENNVVVLKADKSQTNPEVDALLEELGNSATAIPYYAIYEPNKETVHFNGVFLSPGGFIERLAESGVDFAQPDNSDSEKLESEPLTRASLKKYRDEGRDVFVYVTADWNMTCKLVEKMALFTPEVKTIFEKNNFRVLIADITQPNEEVNAVFEQQDLGPPSISTLVFYEPNKKLVKLNEVYQSPESFLKALTDEGVTFGASDNATASNSRSDDSANALARLPDGR